jgi:hypothetical protein
MPTTPVVPDVSKAVTVPNQVTVGPTTDEMLKVRLAMFNEKVKQMKLKAAMNAPDEIALKGLSPKEEKETGPVQESVDRITSVVQTRRATEDDLKMIEAARLKKMQEDLAAKNGDAGSGTTNITNINTQVSTAGNNLELSQKISGAIAGQQEQGFRNQGIRAPAKASPGSGRSNTAMGKPIGTDATRHVQRANTPTSAPL